MTSTVGQGFTDSLLLDLFVSSADGHLLHFISSMKRIKQPSYATRPLEQEFDIQRVVVLSVVTMNLKCV